MVLDLPWFCTASGKIEYPPPKEKQKKPPKTQAVPFFKVQV